MNHTRSGLARPVSIVIAVFFSVLAISTPVNANSDGAKQQPSGQFVIAIHGGGGVRDKDKMTPELEQAYRQTLKKSLAAGHKVLAQAGNSVAAVEAAIVVLEDSPLFNAGKGSSFNREGYHELDASIMDGRTSNAGAVGVVQRVKNPIKLARSIMDDTPHVMLAGAGALEYARSAGLEIVSPHYFWTERKWKSLQKRLRQNTPYGKKPTSAASDDVNRPGPYRVTVSGDTPEPELFGTVGAVALDQYGNLAAGTSTGGRSAKLPGRVGDSPIIGAGNYANNATLAASSTGLGEYVIRVVSTKLMSDLMHYKGLSMEEAVTTSMQKVADLGGGHSVIAIDKQGQVVMRYSGDGMYRGYSREDGKIVTFIYED